MRPSLFQVLFTETKGAIELRAFHKDTEQPIDRLFSRDSRSISEWIGRNKDRANLFFGVATRRPESTSGKKEDCFELPAYWCDIDFKNFLSGEKDARERLTTFPLKPTVVVFTGGGLHVYWAFKESEILDENVSEHESTLKGIAKSLNGDPGACDISRVLRVPGSINYPTKKKLLDGRTKAALCQIEYCHEI